MNYQYIETALTFAAEFYAVEWKKVAQNNNTQRDVSRARHLAVYTLTNYLSKQCVSDVLGLSIRGINGMRFYSGYKMTNDKEFRDAVAELSKLLDKIQSQKLTLTHNNAA